MTQVLDTTVFIDALRDHPGAIAYLRSLRGRPSASEATRVEVLRGLRSSERYAMERLFQLIDWRPVDESTARIAGEFGRRYRKSHPGIGLADLLAAATAERLGSRVATSNTKHFPMFPRLKAPY